jgi:uncharacterized repeat protein (TIGR03803 family)
MTIFRLAALLALAAAFVHGRDAAAATVKPLYEFCSQTNCTDGQAPRGDLAMDASGDLFGVTAGGGDTQDGTVFELVRNQKTGGWTYQRVYSFCSAQPCLDGLNPAGGLVIDTQGRLYGVTSFGGAFGFGTLYQLAQSGGNWTYKVLANFCTQTDCEDSGRPFSGLSYKGQASGTLYDGTSPLYGTTEEGGAANEGLLFEAVPGAQEWKLSTLYGFCAQPNCADGSLPEGGVSFDATGAIYGITSHGGGNTVSAGTVFRLSSKNGHKWKQKVLYSFCSQDQCTDGVSPNPITIDANGDILGTATLGGAHNKGLVFRLKHGGAHQGYKVLYDFCAEKKCTDGATPEGPVTVDASGNMFGTTTVGGTGFKDASHQGGGTIFEISGSHYQTLVDFCRRKSCFDGGFPWGALLPDGNGNYFGVAENGGSKLGGMIFELTP